MFPQLWLATILVLSHGVIGSRILGLFPYIGKSHFTVTGALMKGLASRGHEVVVVSHYPLGRPMPNYTDISLAGSITTTTNSLPIDEVASGAVSTNMASFIVSGLEACEKALSFPAVQDLLASKEHFDLIVTEFFNSDCLLGFVHKFNVPYIAMGTSVILPWSNSRFGNPDNPSYMPTQFSDSSDTMDFTERFLNAVNEETLKWIYDLFITRPSEEMSRRFFGNSLPPLSELVRNASLLLMNTHFSINKPRPFVPAIVEVAGLHIGEPTKLPQDIQKFLDEAEHGVIYFTLGSQVRVDSLGPDKMDAFLKAFSELPQRVLWKWEGHMPEQPKNVKIARWLPQSDVLCHPSVRVFITHAGLLGTIEAVNCGVPMIVIPLFGDQPHNAQCLVSIGVAKRLNYHDIDKSSLQEVLTSVLTNSSYRENAKRLQHIFRDRPMPPLETAIFWTEYVIRHGGAPHLRSAALDLYWFQYLLLDVIAFVVLIFIIIIVTLSYMCSLIKRSRNKSVSDKKVN